MDSDAIQSELERELWAHLKTLKDAKLSHLIAAIDHVRHIRALGLSASEDKVEQKPPSLSPDVTSISSTPKVPLTRGDAAVLILQHAGIPLHADEIVEAMKQYDFETSRARLAWVLNHDQWGRFINIGNNVFKLDAAALAAMATEYVREWPLRQRKTPRVKALKGSLKQAVVDAIATVEGEFDQPMIYELVRQQHPEAAMHIQRTSVSVTLSNLANKEKVIEVVSVGGGRVPKTYRKKPQGTILPMLFEKQKRRESQG
jgi:hypothetical protein